MVESRAAWCREPRVWMTTMRQRLTKRSGYLAVYRLTTSQNHFRERLRLYGRLDREDLERTILVVEEAWVEWKAKPFRVRAGFDLLNWTATEAFHPSDILNSRNLDSSIQNYDKLGEPMVSLSYKGAIGVLTAYFLPSVINPILPSPNSRLSFFSRASDAICVSGSEWRIVRRLV